MMNDERGTMNALLAEEVPTPDTRHPIPSILLDVMPAAGADGLIEIPIAVTGKWKRGEMEFSNTSDDLAAMAANFKKRKNGEINIDYDHASEMPEVARGGPVPSAGRILKMRSNGALYASVEFTARALELIKAKEYRFVSPAIGYGVKDKQSGEDQGTTLTSLALTNRPFLEELPPLRLSEISGETRNSKNETRTNQAVEGAKHDRMNARGAAGENTMLKPKKIEAGEHAGKYGCYEGDALVGVMEEADLPVVHDGRFSDESFAAFLTDVGIPKEAHTPDKLKAMLMAGEAAQARAQAEDSRRLLLTEVIEGGKVNAVFAANYLAERKITPEDFKAGIAAERRVDGAIQAGKLLPRHRGEGIRLVLMETDSFKPFKAFIEEGRPLVNLNPKGLAVSGSSGNATTDLVNLAKARMAEKNVPYSQALTEVSRENPQLAREHRERVTGGEK